MSVFIDTSALYAVMDANDVNHERALTSWEDILGKNEPLVSHNYVLVETLALLQYRLGVEAVAAFQDAIAPILTIELVAETEHLSGITTVITANRRKLSLVDCVSFIIMRKLGITTVFAFDQHFKQQG